MSGAPLASNQPSGPLSNSTGPPGTGIHPSNPYDLPQYEAFRAPPPSMGNFAPTFAFQPPEWVSHGVPDTSAPYLADPYQSASVAENYGSMSPNSRDYHASAYEASHAPPTYDPSSDYSTAINLEIASHHTYNAAHPHVHVQEPDSSLDVKPAPRYKKTTRSAGPSVASPLADISKDEKRLKTTRRRHYRKLRKQKSTRDTDSETDSPGSSGTDSVDLDEYRKEFSKPPMSARPWNH